MLNSIAERKTFEWRGLSTTSLIPYDKVSAVSLPVDIRQGDANPLNAVFDKLVDNDLYNEQLVLNITEGRNVPGATVTNLSATVLNGAENQKFALTSMSEPHIIIGKKKIADNDDQVSSVPFFEDRHVNFCIYDGRKYVVGTKDGMYCSGDRYEGWHRVGELGDDYFLESFEGYDCRCCIRNVHMGEFKNPLDDYEFFLGTNDGIFGLNLNYKFGEDLSWTRLNGSRAVETCNQLTLDPIERCLFACTTRGLFKLDGFTCVREKKTYTYDIPSMVCLSSKAVVESNERLLIATPQGIMQSTNAYFPTSVNVVADSDDVRALTIRCMETRDNHSRYIGTKGQGLWRLENTGNPKTKPTRIGTGQIAANATVTSLAGVNPAKFSDTSALYAVSNGTVLYSTNDGNTFTRAIGSANSYVKEVYNANDIFLLATRSRPPYLAVAEVTYGEYADADLSPVNFYEDNYGEINSITIKGDDIFIASTNGIHCLKITTLYGICRAYDSWLGYASIASLGRTRSGNLVASVTSTNDAVQGTYVVEDLHTRERGPRSSNAVVRAVQLTDSAVYGGATVKDSEGTHHYGLAKFVSDEDYTPVATALEGATTREILPVGANDTAATSPWFLAHVTDGLNDSLHFVYGDELERSKMLLTFGSGNGHAKFAVHMSASNVVGDKSRVMLAMPPCHLSVYNIHHDGKVKELSAQRPAENDIIAGTEAHPDWTLSNREVYGMHLQSDTAWATLDSRDGGVEVVLDSTATKPSYYTMYHTGEVSFIDEALENFYAEGSRFTLWSSGDNILVARPYDFDGQQYVWTEYSDHTVDVGSPVKFIERVSRPAADTEDRDSTWILAGGDTLSVFCKDGRFAPMPSANNDLRRHEAAPATLDDGVRVITNTSRCADYWFAGDLDDPGPYEADNWGSIKKATTTDLPDKTTAMWRGGGDILVGSYDGQFVCYRSRREYRSVLRDAGDAAKRALSGLGCRQVGLVRTAEPLSGKADVNGTVNTDVVAGFVVYGMYLTGWDRNIPNQNVRHLLFAAGTNLVPTVDASQTGYAPGEPKIVDEVANLVDPVFIACAGEYVVAVGKDSTSMTQTIRYARLNSSSHQANLERIRNFDNWTPLTKPDGRQFSDDDIDRLDLVSLKDGKVFGTFCGSCGLWTMKCGPGGLVAEQRRVSPETGWAMNFSQPIGDNYPGEEDEGDFEYRFPEYAEYFEIDDGKATAVVVKYDEQGNLVEIDGTSDEYMGGADWGEYEYAVLPYVRTTLDTSNEEEGEERPEVVVAAREWFVPMARLVEDEAFIQNTYKFYTGYTFSKAYRTLGLPEQLDGFHRRTLQVTTRTIGSGEESHLEYYVVSIVTDPGDAETGAGPVDKILFARYDQDWNLYENLGTQILDYHDPGLNAIDAAIGSLVGDTTYYIMVLQRNSAMVWEPSTIAGYLMTDGTDGAPRFGTEQLVLCDDDIFFNAAGNQVYLNSIVRQDTFNARAMFCAGGPADRPAGLFTLVYDGRLKQRLKLVFESAGTFKTQPNGEGEDANILRFVDLHHGSHDWVAGLDNRTMNLMVADVAGDPNPRAAGTLAGRNLPNNSYIHAVDTINKQLYLGYGSTTARENLPFRTLWFGDPQDYLQSFLYPNTSQAWDAATTSKGEILSWRKAETADMASMLQLATAPDYTTGTHGLQTMQFVAGTGRLWNWQPYYQLEKNTSLGDDDREMGHIAYLPDPEDIPNRFNVGYCMVWPGVEVDEDTKEERQTTNYAFTFDVEAYSLKFSFLSSNISSMVTQTNNQCTGVGVLKDGNYLLNFDQFMKVLDVNAGKLYNFELEDIQMLYADVAGGSLEPITSLSPMAMGKPSIFMVANALDIVRVDDYEVKRCFEVPRDDYRILLKRFFNRPITSLFALSDRDIIVGTLNTGTYFVRNLAICTTYLDRSGNPLNGATKAITSVLQDASKSYLPKYLFSSGDKIYASTDTITDFEEITTLPTDCTINSILAERDTMYSICTNVGLFITDLGWDIDDELHRFSVESVSALAVEDLEPLLAGHIWRDHEDNEFWRKLYEKAPAAISAVPPGFTAHAGVDLNDAVYIVSGDIVSRVEFNDSNKYIRASVKNWATDQLKGEAIYSNDGYIDRLLWRDKRQFDLSEIPYVCKFWESGLREIIVYVPTTLTFYMNNPRGFSNSDYSGKSIPRRNVSDTVAIDNTVPTRYTSLRLLLDNQHFNLRSIVSIQINGTSLPLKMYKDSQYCQGGREGIFDSVVEPSVVRCLPTIATAVNDTQDNMSAFTDGDGMLVLEFAVYGTDAQSIRIVAASN